MVRRGDAPRWQVHPWVLHPRLLFRMKWDLLVMFLTIYCCYAIPYRVSLRLI